MLDTVIDTDACPLDDDGFIDACHRRLAWDGVITIPGFLRPDAVSALVTEAESQAKNAHFTSSTHNVYLTPTDPALAGDHVFNRQITSSKGCITTDQVPDGSTHPSTVPPHSSGYRGQWGAGAAGICRPALIHHQHYAADGQELGCHFDNSSFAVTLLLQAPEAGGAFQYVRDLRDADAGELNFKGVADVLDGNGTVETLDITPGTLVLFRGRNSMHRVTPTIGDRTRILVVLAYNTEPGIALSEAARMTFYGRLG